MTEAAPTLDELRDQEARLVLPSLSENDAIDIGLRLLALATERDLVVTIEVRRASRVVFRAARTGTNAHNDMYVAGKARIVERFGHSTMLERLRHEANGTTFAEATSLAFPEYAPHGGGFPLAVDGTRRRRGGHRLRPAPGAGPRADRRGPRRVPGRPAWLKARDRRCRAAPQPDLTRPDTQLPG